MDNKKLLSALQTNLSINKEIKSLLSKTALPAPTLKNLQELIDDSSNQLKALSQDL